MVLLNIHLERPPNWWEMNMRVIARCKFTTSENSCRLMEDNNLKHTNTRTTNSNSKDPPWIGRKSNSIIGCILTGLGTGSNSMIQIG